MRASVDFAAQGDAQVLWEARPLASFEETPVREIAREYDMLILDHPLIGQAVDDAALFDLAELLSPADLERRRQDSVGASFSSYEYGGGQWALPVDAAAQVSVFRADLLDAATVPQTWDGALALVREMRDRSTRAALPLGPVHCHCLMLALGCDRAGPDIWCADSIDGELLEWILTTMWQLSSNVHPASAHANPISLSELMVAGEVSYVPLMFGYSTYARREVDRPLSFALPPSRGARPWGSVLGGAGIAVSSSCPRAAEAAAFASFVTEPDYQRTAWVESGGQPASLTAWRDKTCGLLTSGFFDATVAAVEAAHVRDRDSSSVLGSRTIGNLLSRWMTEHEAPRIELWAKTLGRHLWEQRQRASELSERRGETSDG
ncbi:MAG: extracellular solute-binding protein [Chloroflexota bacterium]